MLLLTRLNIGQSCTGFLVFTITLQFPFNSSEEFRWLKLMNKWMMKNCDQCMMVPPWKIIVMMWKDDVIFLIKTAEIRNEKNSKIALKRRLFGVKRNRSQGPLDNPAHYLFLLYSNLNVSIPSWQMLCEGCLSGESGTRTCLFYSPETGLWFQPAVSRLALISCAHTHILAFIS